MHDLNALKDRKKKSINLEIIIGSPESDKFEDIQEEEKDLEMAEKEIESKEEELEGKEEQAVAGLEDENEQLKKEEQSMLGAMAGSDDPDMVLEEFKNKKPMSLAEKVKYALAMKAKKG